MLGLQNSIFKPSKKSFKMCFAKWRKNWKNKRLWLPKTFPKSFQNASENDVPRNIRFFNDFCSKQPLSQERRHRFCIGFSNTFCLSDAFLQIALGMHFWFKKHTKNPSETMSEPSKNRCQKRIVFRHRFFWVLASILEPIIGPPSWSQVGNFRAKNFDGCPFEPS